MNITIWKIISQFKGILKYVDGKGSMMKIVKFQIYLFPDSQHYKDAISHKFIKRKNISDISDMQGSKVLNSSTCGAKYCTGG